MGIPALAFCETAFSSPKPKGSKVSFEPTTLGDHIRKKRLELGLLQENVAELIGVTTDCITNWENKRSYPQIQFMPAIIKFIGFVPLAIDMSKLKGQILLYRCMNGLSYKKFADLLEVDAGTVSDWERGKSYPIDSHFKKLDRLIRIE